MWDLSRQQSSNQQQIPIFNLRNIFQLTWAISNPRPSPSMMLFAGTRTFSNVISACPWGASSKPNTVNGLFMWTPGVWTSTKIIDCCLCFAALKSVFPCQHVNHTIHYWHEWHLTIRAITFSQILTMTIRILHLGSIAPLVHHFVPLIIYESPCL